MIQIENLEKKFGPQTLFSKATFHIQKNEKCALLGKNGSGKTTFLHILAGQESADDGDIRVPKGYRFGSLKQHLQFGDGSLLEEAMKGIASEKQYIAEKFLFGLGFLKEDLSKPTQSFSGGFQLRLHLCQVLLSEPDGLLLDEPTNYLDLPSIVWMKKFLSSWKGELVIISHDRSFLDSVCDSCIGIHRGTIHKYVGNTEKFYQTLCQEEEVHEKTRVNLEKKKAHLEKFVERFGAKASKASQAQSRVKALEKMSSLEKLVELKSLSFQFSAAHFPGRMMLEASDISFSYHTHQPDIVKELSIQIEKGERIAVIGKNGRGKSTLLKLLAEECSPSKGHIKKAEGLKIGYFGQTHIARLTPELTIEEEVQNAHASLTIGEVRSLCGKMLFEGDLAKKKIGVLSGGEKSRVLIAKILASPAHLLLLDEPTHHLDMESVEALLQALQNFPGSIVLVTHSEQVLHALAPTKLIICREEGQEVFLGDYALFLEKKGWEEQKAASSCSTTVNRHSAPQGKNRSSLNTLNKEIARLEKAWLALEQEIEILQTRLIELATLPQKREEAHKISLAFEEKRKESDFLFEKLEQLQKEKALSF